MLVSKSTFRRSRSTLRTALLLLIGGLALVFTFAAVAVQPVQAVTVPFNVSQLVTPQQNEVVIPVTLVELFKFLGTPIFVGFIVSFLLERVSGFQALATELKALLSLALAAGFSLLSYWLVNYVPTAFIQALEPWYAAAVTGVIGFVASQVWHKIFNTSGITLEAWTGDPDLVSRE